MSVNRTDDTDLIILKDEIFAIHNLRDTDEIVVKRLRSVQAVSCSGKVKETLINSTEL